MILNSDLKPLSDVMQGASVALHSINAGKGLVSKLSTMGLVAGVQFRVLNKSCRGRMVLLINGSRLALGAGIAPRLVVVEH
jgi:Fe2+ transport system protein FeoA